MRASSLLALSLALLFPLPALAQCPIGPDVPADQCHAADVDFQHLDRALPSVSLDSGWVPAGSPIQVHFALLIMAETEVDLGGTVVTSWPTTPPMRAVAVRVPGRPATGRLNMAYGFEIVAEMRLHLDVAGTVYDWTGDIPLPGSFPRDLRLAATTTFDPFLLPGAPGRPVSAMDSTAAVRVIGLSVSSLVGVSIPGIDGGIDMSAQAMLTTRYQSERIDVVRSPSFISNEGASAPLPPVDTLLGFGPSTDVTVLPHGRVLYDGAVTLTPAIYVTLAGRRWDLATFDIPLHLVETDTETHFMPDTVHVPLPDIRLDPPDVDLGDVAVSATAEGTSLVRNEGEADLVVSVVPPGGPFTVAPASMRLAPHESRALVVRYAPTEVEPDATTIVTLTTNDPDASAIALRVHAMSHAAPARDAGPPDASRAPDAATGPGHTNAGGCGCGVAARPQPGLLAIGLVALALVRRRSRG